jgi:hypothetical protein
VPVVFKKIKMMTERIEEIVKKATPHTDSSGESLIRSYLTKGKPVALVFNEEQEVAASAVGFLPVYVHHGNV